MEDKILEIYSSEFNTLIICSMRYAMGRRTYIVGDICNLIKNNLDKIEDKTLGCIQRDLKEAIQEDISGLTSLGDRCDKEKWFDLKVILDEELRKRKLEEWR